MDATELLTWDDDANIKLGVEVVAATLEHFGDDAGGWKFVVRVANLDTSLSRSLAVEIHLLDQHGAPVDTAIEALHRAPTGGGSMSARIYLFSDDEEAMVVRAFARVRLSAPHADDTPLDVPVSANTDALTAAGYTLAAVRATCVAAERTGRAEVITALRVAYVGRPPVLILRAVDAQGLPAKGAVVSVDLYEDPAHPGVHIGTATLELAEVPTRILLSPSRIAPSGKEGKKTLPDIPDECFEPIGFERA